MAGKPPIPRTYVTTIARHNGRIPTDPTVWFALIFSLWVVLHLSIEEVAAFPLVLSAVRELLTPGTR
jgi:hypothetical protein